MKYTYYHIKSLDLFAKSSSITDNYIYMDGEWIKDDDFIVSDRLVGFDPSEPKDSPYRMGNTDIMSDLEEISEEEFKERIE